MRYPRWLPRPSLSLLFWIVVLGFVGYRFWPQVAAAFAIRGTEAEAPAGSLVTLNGDALALDDLRGKVVLVNFWATWCPPCRFEMPGFQRVYEDRRDDGFVVLGLSQDQGGTEVVQDFLDERGITFPVAMGTPEMERSFGGVSALPTSFLIDRQGRIRHRVTGVFAEPALRMAVDRLLKEPAAPPTADSSAAAP